MYQWVEFQLHCRRFIVVAEKGGFCHRGHEFREQIRRDGDNARCPHTHCGDGKVVVARKDVRVARQHYRVGHLRKIPRRFFDGDDVFNFCKFSESFRQNVDAGARRNVVNDNGFIDGI